MLSTDRRNRLLQLVRKGQADEATLKANGFTNEDLLEAGIMNQNAYVQSQLAELENLKSQAEERVERAKRSLQEAELLVKMRNDSIWFRADYANREENITYKDLSLMLGEAYNVTRNTIQKVREEHGIV